MREITFTRRTVRSVMRSTLLVLAALAVLSVPAAASTMFVSPLDGAQVFGLTVIEVKSDVAAIDRVDFFVDDVLAGVARSAPYRIAFDFGSTMIARRVSAKVWANGYQSSETVAVRTAALTMNDRLDVHLVEVPVRVQSTRTVAPDDLRVRENGVEQTVRDVRRERPPAHFAFVVDRSLSMNEGKLEAALQAIEDGLRQLRPNDTASVVLFDHRVSKPRKVAAGQDLSELVTTPSGGTSLRDAIASVASPARTYALVITDGGDRNSELTDEQALRRISGTKTMVHAIVLGRSHAKFLDHLAANTGGSVVGANAGSVGDKVSELLADINSRYLVIYQSQGTESGWRTVDVRARRGGLRVAGANKRYFAE